MNKPKILVVDDEILNVEFLEGFLSKDYEVMRAYDGHEAIIKAEKNYPDLILLDILIAGINGYEVCTRIKNNDKTTSIPVVMLTILNEKGDRIKAIESGADDFLNKPIDMDVLNARVKSLLRLKQYCDSLKQFNPQAAVPGGEVIEINRAIKGVMNAENPVGYIYPPEEDIVKNHLEMIILKLLYDRSMCGIDIIKEIFIKYNVLLSQGTVYPFLYSLKKDGVVRVEFLKGNMRTKIYSATQEGRQIIEKRIIELINAEEYILNSIKHRGS